MRGPPRRLGSFLVLALASTAMGGERPLTLVEAVREALGENPVLLQSEVQVELAHTGIAEAHGRRFSPKLEVELTGTYERKPAADVPSGVTPGPLVEASAEYTKPFASGLELGVRVHHVTEATPNPFIPLNPEHQTEVRVIAEQRLLKGRGEAVNAAEVNAAGVREQAATLELHRAKERLAGEVATSYWTLAYAQRAVQIQEESVQLGDRLVHLTEDLVKAGAAAPPTIALARSSLSLRQAHLAEAHRDLAEAARQLAAVMLLADPSVDLRAQDQLAPRAAVAEAGEQERADVAAAKANVSAEALLKDSAEDEVRPDLRASAFAGVWGLGGAPSPLSCQFFGPSFVPAGCVENGPFSSGVASLGTTAASGRFFFVGASLKLSFPWGSEAEKARADAARLRWSLAKLSAEATARDAKSERAALERTAELEAHALDAARAALDQARALVNVEERRYALHANTTLDVVKAQDGLVEARLLEARVQADAAITHARLLLSQGRILETLGLATR